MLNNFQIPDAVIPNGAAVSNVFNSAKHHMTAEAIMIIAPAALDAATFTFEVNPDQNAVAASPGWATLQIGDPASDAAPPGIGKARLYYELPAAPSWRIRSSINQTADRIFKVSGSGYAG